MQDNLIVFPEHPPDEEVQSVTHALPVSLTPLIGREQEVQAIKAALLRPEVRLLTLTGTAGVGKTRLAFEVARELVHDFADGVHIVFLAPISDPDLVIPTIAHHLGLMENGSQPLLELLKMSQREKQRLLVLDNFEQVIEASPLLIEFLEACPDVKLLVTSREVLRLRGEQQFSVMPLALLNPKHLPDDRSLTQVSSMKLFLQRAKAIQSDFEVTADNAATIAQICLRLDGLPLAIELAAARIKVLAPQALLARLDHRLHVLTGGARDLPLRQQTMHNTLTWSYELLTSAEQRLFQRISVFTGGTTLEAIEAVCEALGDEKGKVFDGVASLLDKSLIQSQTQGDEEPRLMMLETIREYGLEPLAASGEMEAIRQAHALYYLALVEQAEPKLSGPQQAMWLERLERERDNLRKAMQWSLEREGEMALRFGAALQPFWIVHGYWSEGRTFLDQALAASKGTVTSARVKALVGAASLAVFLIDAARGEALCRESLSLCQEQGDTVGAAYSLYLLGTLAWQRGDFASARSSMRESLALYKNLGAKERIASVLDVLAELDTQQGDYIRARSLLEESLAIFREMGSALGTAASLRALALMLFVSRDDPATVHSLLEESLALSRELGSKANIARCLSHSALVTLHEGDLVMARELAEESLALHRETGDPWGIAWVLSIVARVEAHQGAYTTAHTLLEESMALAGKIGSKLIIAFCLEGLASLAVTQGEPARAARLWGVAEVLRESMGAPIWPVECAAYERSMAAARTQLGEQAFVTAWTEGRCLTPDQVLGTPGQAVVSFQTPAGQSAISTTMSSLRHPAGLTAREVEVLRLLAQGLTSAQIAEQLVISLLTVNTHVRSIYSKLGVNSRSSATRYAVEHQLM